MNEAERKMFELLRHKVEKLQAKYPPGREYGATAEMVWDWDFIWLFNVLDSLIKQKGESMSYAINLENIFTYHAPKGNQQERYVKLREKAKEYAALVLELVPECPDRTRCINMIGDSNMVANAAIARNE